MTRKRKAKTSGEEAPREQPGAPEVETVENQEGGFDVKSRGETIYRATERTATSIGELQIELTRQLSEAYTYARMVADSVPADNTVVQSMVENLQLSIERAIGILKEIERIRSYWQKRRNSYGNSYRGGQGRRDYGGGYKRSGYRRW